MATSKTLLIFTIVSILSFVVATESDDHLSTDKDLRLIKRVPRATIQRECFPYQEPERKWCYFTKPNGWWFSNWWRSWWERKFTYRACCPGYGGSSCQAKCHDVASVRACNRYEGLVLHKDGIKTTCSGGACIAPNQCTLCNTGYYADNSTGYCKACSSIEHCNILRCTDGSSSVCSWCDGEVVYKEAGKYAYTSHVDPHQCMRACSWRPGTRCYPGLCNGDMLYPSQCACADGFEGPDCATFSSNALDKLKINSPGLTLYGEKAVLVPDPSFLNRKVWTNQIDMETVMLEVPVSFDAPGIHNESRKKQTYINFLDTKIGITLVIVNSTLTRGNMTKDWANVLNCSFAASCTLSTKVNRLRDTPWNDILKNSFPKPFAHLDKIQVNISLTNGGIVHFEDREINASGHYAIIGKTVTRTLELEFDLYPPVHCMEDLIPCDIQPLKTPDFVKDTPFEVTWGGWEDGNSGIHSFHFEVYKLEVLDKKSGVLKDTGTKVFNTTVDASKRKAMINVTHPGAYFVEVSAIDWADNEKTARRFFIFDDKSIVKVRGDTANVSTADPLSDFTWINKKSESIEVRWPNRFINEMHHVNGWLNEIAFSEHVSEDLEDVPGMSNRTIAAIHNIQGIVKFTVGYNITYGYNATEETVEAVTVADDMFDAQKYFIHEALVDGKRLQIFIRGYDVLEEYAEDSTTVTIDLSPPIIENMCLTKGSITNVTVHSEQELNKLTVELDAFDIHSGLHLLSWRIYDNYTKTDIVHGSSHETTQGNARSLEECELKYANHSQGPSCYCTPFNGCFHKHFRVTPQVTVSGNNGILAALSTGVHESDYYFEVRVVNNALLETVSVIKITIDTSPPHAGSVHDGFPDQPEVDFQQSRELNSYWDGFFDKESGVWFYLYGYGLTCLASSEFDIYTTAGNFSQRLVRTYTPFGSYTAPTLGTYHVTVVAFNHALDHSSPICSDGVTVDVTEIEVSDVVVKGSVTRAGLIKDSADHVWLLNNNRERIQIEQPTALCVNKASIFPNDRIQNLPSIRHSIGTEKAVTSDVCRQFSGVPSDLRSFITLDSHLDISWNVPDIKASIHDFEVGLSNGNSTPDTIGFVSSRQHRHIRLPHPNIWNGEQFYVIIRTISKSAITKETMVGPFSVDTTRPDFHGVVLVELEKSSDGKYLVASWQPGAFVDHGDPTPLQYTVAIGTTKYGHNVLPFGRLSPGCSCLTAVTCTAINIDRLDWRLHGHQRYYVTVKAANTVGLFTLASSGVYVHDVELPSQGVVYDVDIENDVLLQDIIDVDFQTRNDILSAKWTGFLHPHVNVTFNVCIYDSNTSDVVQCADVGQATEHTFTNLNLKEFKTYTQGVTAITEAWNVTVSSDGVTVVVENVELQNVVIKDGLGCPNDITDGITLNTPYHTEDNQLVCQDDVNFQASVNDIQARWTIPDDVMRYTPDVYWSVEERAPIADIWHEFRKFEHIKTSRQLSVSHMMLMAGRRYRVVLKFCAMTFCFKPVHSDGFTVLSRPPVPGELFVAYDNNTNQINVEYNRFYDPDVEAPDDAREAVQSYEWAFTDNSEDGRLLTRWTVINSNASLHDDKLKFSVPMSPNITFTKCWKLALRGYNKVGLSSVISKEIKNCSDVNHVRPHAIIDAIGQPSPAKSPDTTSHSGQPVSLKGNEKWTQSDKDYTPYTNILSAVWPTLRYEFYTWAVIEVQDEDPTIFYNSDLDLQQPCEHPDAIKCGTTENEYMNALFSEGELIHGRRYKVCVQANATVLPFEKWDLSLEEFHACSDGITIDLTPPTPAAAWIGNSITDKYQTSSSCLTVNWQSFIDVEEGGQGPHVSGVQTYQVALGTANGGVDTANFVTVGLTNHHMFHGLHLQNGHSYFASVKAIDFTGQYSIQVSRPVIVDTTPPQTTGKPIKLSGRHITDPEVVSACWSGVFTDLESGLSHFKWSVGSQRGYDDVMTYTRTEEECGKSDGSVALGLLEGHAYFVSVQAYNHAGHYALAVSWAFTVEASPPVAGQVYDGPRGHSGSYKDVDFVTQISVIEAHWSEFYEVHGTVKDYTISIGSCAGCDDVLQNQPVGIIYDVILEQLVLSEGKRYFVTVTACNTADLCTSSSSDGVIVDTTAPSPGRVLDGVEGKDIQYQASRLFLGAKWFGFTDPQSGISHFVWRVGTSPGSDDILSATEVHQLQEAFVVDLSAINGKTLPVGVRIYTTVRAYNKAGMFSESTSNGFLVDTSGPVFSRHISHILIGTALPNTSVLPHVIRVEWEVGDNESFIGEQHLSIVSHIGGDFNTSSIKVAGIVRDYTFSDLDLHDGSVYCVTLVSCNGARMCEETRLQHLLVDSSHPSPGMFAINTGHSVAINREPKDWMAWTVGSVKLAWLGFQDVHSGIDRYLINIGGTFMGNDLHKLSSDAHVVRHVDHGNQTDEGIIQTQEIYTKSLAKIRTVFITIWAINGVGLSSPMVHHEFELAFGGSMELVRRCSAHTCLGHCVCAPHGQLCHSDNECHDVTDANSNYVLSVKDFIDISFTTNTPIINHTPAKTLSAATWIISKQQGRAPSWYEWSIGETRYDTPKGVFNATKEIVWHDAGQNTSWIFSHHKGHYLKDKMTYSFFVRAWYDTETFAVFKSPGLMVYTSPPQSLSVQGRMVKETIQAGDKDIDFIDEKLPLVIDWTGKFTQDNCLTRFQLYISTSPEGHDAYCIQKNLPPSVTSFNLTGYRFEADTVYYSVVQAYNMAGFQTTEYSDGFKIDGRDPIPGLVNDGQGFADIHAVNSSRVLDSFWYGFSDPDSGIRGYNVCVSIENKRLRCTAHPNVNVGLTTSARLYQNVAVSDGVRLITEVRGFDVVGHSTPFVRSNGVIVDSSPPKRAASVTYQHNHIHNPSFEVAALDHSLADIQQTTSCDNYQPNSWVAADDRSCIIEVRAYKDQVLPDGQRYVVLTGSMRQLIRNLTIGAKYRITLFSSHVPMKAAILSSCEGHVIVGSEKHIFLMYGKPGLSSDAADTFSHLSWHEHVYYFQPKDSAVTLEIGTEGMTNHIAIDGVRFEQRSEYADGVEAEMKGHVQAKTVFIHDWSSLHAEWNFIDDHCDIVEYLWAVGTVEGGTQLQPFTSVGKRTFAFTPSLHLVHNTTVYVTVLAINAASLRTISYSDPIFIDLTPPAFIWITDGPERGKDIDFQRGVTVYVHWAVEDPDSGIASCTWTLYTGNGDSPLQEGDTITDGARNASTVVNLNNLTYNMVYAAVTCVNRAGLTSHVKTDGVKIVTSPPSVHNVLIQITGSSSTQYPVHDGYHGNSSYVSFRWTGYEDDEGVNSYLVALDGADVHIEELVQGHMVGIRYASFSDLDLRDGNYAVSVTAINHLDMYSQKQTRNFVLLTQKPKLTGTPILTLWTPSTAILRVTWSGVFVATSGLYYEVTTSWVGAGDGDVMQWQKTKDTGMQVGLSFQDVPADGIDLRVSVRAITPAGHFETARTELFISKH